MFYRSVLIAACLVAPTLAMGFDAHHSHDSGYALDIEPHRVYTFNADIQRTLRHSISWSQFTNGEGQGWTARFDEVTGEPLRAFGAGIDIGLIDDQDDAVRALLQFVGRNASAFQTSPKLLGPGTASYNANFDTWYVDLPAMYEGAPVWRAGVTGRIKNGKLVMVGSQTYAEVPRLGELRLSETDAIDTAIDLGPAPQAEHTVTSAQVVWLPLQVNGELSLVRTWEIHSHTAEPLGEWVAFVDAETGELLNIYNEIAYISGAIQAEVHPRRASDPLETRPIVDAWITSGAERVSTDEGGNYAIGGSSYQIELRGDDLVLRDAADGNNIPSATTSLENALLTTSFASQPALDAWVSLQTTQAFWKDIAPGVNVGGTSASNKLTANVNVSGGNCNAFYSPQQGTVNFFPAGGGCNNTASVADVVYHEWGHGFHRFSIQRGGFDGSLSEGAADTVAFLQTNGNIIAPSFRTNGSGIRDVAPNRSYPENYVNDQRYIHQNGLIFGGAMWDLVAELEPRYGREEANRVVARITAGALKAGTGIATIGEEILVADDDDGDLANGTPHYCEILDALDAHGLLPELALEVLVEHDQLVEAEPNAVTLVAEGGGLELDCVDIEDIEVVYRANGGNWQSAPMAVSGGTSSATLPDLPYGTFVEYYLDAGSATVPGGGIRNPLSLFVGGVLPVWFTNFEADDAGFTSELIGGDASSAGANDWQYGRPNATPANGQGGTSVSGDPDGAYSGNMAWGNDLGNVTDGPDGNPQYWNGVYQGDRHNRLNSPAIEVPPHLEGVFLRYARWLNVEDGSFDKAQILADGELVWTNYSSETTEGGEHHEDRRWVIHSVDLGDATSDGELVLSWEIITDQGLHMGGWNIDDVQLLAPATPNNRLAITDFEAGDDQQGGSILSWTNPKYAPLERVIIVRKLKELPTGPDDGEIVAIIDEPELGERMRMQDTTSRPNREYGYAIYGDDGTDTLGWTVQGWNADTGSGFGQSDGIAGCSCDATSSGSGWMFFGVTGLLFALRRRRSQR